MAALWRSGAFALMLGTLLGCAHAGGDDGDRRQPTRTPPDTLHLIAYNDPHSLNPILSNTVTEFEFGRLAFDRLVDSDPDNRLVPVLATVVPTLANGGIARDGLTYTFHLRHGVRWQDGKPFSSEDVAFSIHAILNPRVNVADRSGYDDIARIETPGPWTVVMHLKHRYAPFIVAISERFPIIPAHLLAKSANLNVDAFNGMPIGTGPYRLMAWDRGSKLRYVANKDYFRGTPRIAKIDVTIMPETATQGIVLRRHDADFAAVESSQYGQLRSVSNLRTTTEPANDFVAMAVNTTRPLLADVRVRRAIVMAIDRDRIAHDNTYGTGVPAYADLPDALWQRGGSASPTPFNPKAAKALLDAAGWHVGPQGTRVKGGRRLHLDAIDFGGSSTGRNINTQLQQMLLAVGIDVSFKYYAVALYYAPASAGGPLYLGNFDLADYDFTAGVDPQNDELYTCANRAPTGFNAARYCNPRMDALQKASLNELDPATRLRYVNAIERLAASDAPYVFLYHTPQRLVWVPSLHRTHSNITDYWYDVRNWTLGAE